MKLGTALIIIGAVLFGVNILYITEPPLAAAVFRTFILPAGLIAWGTLRVRNNYVSKPH